GRLDRKSVLSSSAKSVILGFPPQTPPRDGNGGTAKRLQARTRFRAVSLTIANGAPGEFRKNSSDLSRPPARRYTAADTLKAGAGTMKLLSFAADGKEFFGAVNGDGVVTLNERVGQPSLRAALAAGAMDAMRKASQDGKPDRKLADITFLPVIP